MIVIDKTTGQKWQIFVSDGQIGNRVVTSGVPGEPVIREQYAPTVPLTVQQINDFFLVYGHDSSYYNWELIVNDSQIGIEQGGVSITHPWVRDEVDPTIVWEFRVDGGQLYIAQINTEGYGRIVYVLSGKVYRVYNVRSRFSFTSDLTALITEKIDLECFIPQEEFVQ